LNFSATIRRLLAAALSTGLLLFGAVSAQADTPAHTDVLFLFDTTGSMGGAIEEAQNEVQEAMSQVGASLPDVQFGLAEVSDYDEVVNGDVEFEYGIGEGFAPWTLKAAISPNQSLVVESLKGLSASGGGDSPEAYGRGLFESATNPAVGWRPDARGIIVLIADDVPHDDELNEGIAPEFWVESPFDTGIDPGADNTVGTGDDLDWQSVLQRLVTDGKPLEYVDYQGAEEYVPYWQAWAGRTGGSVISTEGAGADEKLGTKLVEAVKAGALLPTCPSGQARNAASVCVPIPAPAPPSNNFKIEPRISCAKGCYVVNVKIVFDSAGNVIAESVLDEEPAARASSAATASAAPKGSCGKGKGAKAAKAVKCRELPLIKKLSQPVVAGSNTLQLKLTGAAKKVLNKKGKVGLKLRFTFTPTGGAAKSTTTTIVVKKPVKKAAKKAPQGR
jgi:hypothetical protein